TTKAFAETGLKLRLPAMRAAAYARFAAVHLINLASKYSPQLGFAVDLKVALGASDDIDAKERQAIVDKVEALDASPEGVNLGAKTIAAHAGATLLSGLGVY